MNPTPSSTNFCRPLSLKFQNEDAAANSQEKIWIQGKIDKLVATKYEVNGKKYSITQMLCTMIDGKVAAHISNVGCMTCNICSATPSMMNKLENFKNYPLTI
eukprot:Pompholyxophrys_punicea_v1_NODE_668_length_1488_cov_4.501047.p2 type:complete len:102 gc:universal NODE_668_length_1488_cov_4.501047:1342-1037(-)